MIPVCCVCGTKSKVWHDPEWENAGGLQDFCPDHAVLEMKEYIVTHHDPTLSPYAMNTEHAKPTVKRYCLLPYGEKGGHWRDYIKPTEHPEGSYVEWADFAAAEERNAALREVRQMLDEEHCAKMEALRQLAAAEERNARLVDLLDYARTHLGWTVGAEQHICDQVEAIMNPAAIVTPTEEKRV